MSGGGTDAPPPNAGDLLLQLLRKPSQSHAPPHQQQQQQQQQTFSHDPAIAAVGPSTLTYPPFHHSNNINPLNFPPYNYFPQNPNLNPINDFSHLPNDRINPTFVTNKPGIDLVFGSFSQRNQIAAKDSIFNQITPKDSIFNGPSVNSSLGIGENRTGQNGNSRMFPPGFTSKIGEGNGNGSGRRVFDHNVGKGKVGISNNQVDSGNVIKGMLDLRVSDRVEVVQNAESDYEQFMSLLPPKDDESGEKTDANKDHLGVEDESGDTSDKKKNPRDRDYRSDKRGKWILGQKMRNQRSFTSFRSDINSLSAPFLALFESLIPPDEEKVKQKQLVTVLEKLVHKEWPEARLYLYGSCGNSFGFSKSDIDLCLVMELGYVEKSEVLLKLADIFMSENLQNVQALTRARVPIVKLMDPVTGISCDICINNVLAVVNTKLLRDYAKIDSRLRQLVFLVKHWAKSRGVNETYHGTLSSYAYVLMCIHFLQQRRPAILPCLQGMEITYYQIIDGVECAFFDQVDKLRNFGSQNRENIAQLVWGFFHYWAYCHDYANDVISVRTGQTISKRFKDWTRRVGNDRHLICIEDPFEVSHDLGRVVDKSSIRVLREEFERAASIMQYDPNPCVTLFEPYIPD